MNGRFGGPHCGIWYPRERKVWAAARRWSTYKGTQGHAAAPQGCFEAFHDICGEAPEPIAGPGATFDLHRWAAGLPDGDLDRRRRQRGVELHARFERWLCHEPWLRPVVRLGSMNHERMAKIDRPRQARCKRDKAVDTDRHRERYWCFAHWRSSRRRYCCSQPGPWQCLTSCEATPTPQAKGGLRRVTR